MNLVRKLLLIGDGLIFLGFAISTVLNLKWTAAIYALIPDGIGGADEFHAVFLGFWLGLTVLFFYSVRHYRLAILGDMAFLLVLLQSLGRAYSFVVDGIPPTRFVLFFILEFSTSVIGLLIRPSSGQGARTA